jgi:hypothetical protein
MPYFKPAKAAEPIEAGKSEVAVTAHDAVAPSVLYHGHTSRNAGFLGGGSELASPRVDASDLEGEQEILEAIRALGYQH